MKRWQFWLAVVVLSFSAVWASWRWGIEILVTVGYGLSNGSETEADLMARAFPHHLVNPYTVTLGKDWIYEETKARLTVILFLWFCTTAALFLWTRRKKVS
jgi:hypothetical protein